MDPSSTHVTVPQASLKSSAGGGSTQRWVAWTIPLALILASIIHTIIIGVRKKKNTTKRRQALLRIFVGYLIGGVSTWLAIVYLFLPATFAPESVKASGPARRLVGFAWLAFGAGGIISALLKDVDEQRVAIATFTIFMLGAAGVQLYTLKGKEKAIQVYHVPILKLLIAVILIVFASITPSSSK